MKSLASPAELFRERWLRSGSDDEVLALPVVLSQSARASSSASSPGVWERPIRSLLMSMGVIPLATLTYFLAPESATHGHLGAPLFQHRHLRDLGYGDISQTSPPLQLLSAIEAFCGMFLTGLFAGFCLENQAVLTGVPAAGAISARPRCPPAVFPSSWLAWATLFDAAAVERLF